MQIGGIILAVLGTILLGSGFGMSGAAEYSDTLNIGLLNDKSNLIVTGGQLNVCGAIFFAASKIISALAQPVIANAAIDPAISSENSQQLDSGAF